MGSDEWLDADEDGLPNWWELLHFESNTGGDSGEDSDGDGRDNLEEYEQGTNPLMSPRDFLRGHQRE